jgi:hypothetical protein
MGRFPQAKGKVVRHKTSWQEDRGRKILCAPIFLPQFSCQLPAALAIPSSVLAPNGVTLI